MRRCIRHYAVVLTFVLALSPVGGQEAGEATDQRPQTDLPVPQLRQRIPQLIEQMARDDFAGRDASQQLARVGRSTVPALVAATEHSVPRVRYWSIATLSSIGDEKAVPAITKCLDDRNALVRAVAVWHLGRWFDRTEVCDGVVKKLQDEDPFVRGWALKRLQASKCRTALPQVRALLEAKEPEVRYDALHALTVLEGGGALKALKEVLRKDKSPIVREGALRCCTVVEPRVPQTADVMILALSDRDEKVRECAAELLRKGFGQYFEFEAAAEPLERENAVQQWRSWYETNKGKLRWSEKRRRFEIPGEESAAPEQAPGE